MTLIRNIVFVIILIIIVLVLLNFFSSHTSSNLTGINPGNKTIRIDSDKLVSSKNSNNFSYSVWFYVTDWQYRLTETKDLVVRNTRGRKSSSNPHISLAPYENNINIVIDTIQNNSNKNQQHHHHKQQNNCFIRNFPLQRWVNLIISLNGRTLDVYLNGKLVRTCILPGVAKPVGESDIKLTPNGGFSGWTSKLRFWAKPLNPQEAFNVYKEGPGGSSWLSIFDKYKLKISYLVNNVEQGSVSI